MNHLKQIASLLSILSVLLPSPASAQWVQTSGPPGGTIEAFAVSGNKLFAGTSNGVFLSTNYGTSWTAAGLGGNKIGALAVFGSNLFAGDVERGVFLSTDNGISWTATGLTNHGVNILAISGTNLFASTGSGVFLSTNNGTNWTDVSNGLFDYIYALAVSGTNLFAGTMFGGVYLSTNNGTNWMAVNNGLPRWRNNDVYVTSLAVSGTNLFAGTYEWGVFLSTNNGTSWTAVNNGLPRSLHNTTYYGNYEAIVHFSVDEANIFLSTQLDYLYSGGGVFRSTNNGTSWTAIGLTNRSISALAVSGTNIFAGIERDGAFLSTNNGASWTAVNSGLVNTTSYALAVSGTYLFAGTDGQGVSLSTNYGTSWSAINTGLPHPYYDIGGYPQVEALVLSGTSLFAAIGGYGVFLSTDNGTSWAEVNNGLPKYDTTYYDGINSFAVNGTNIFAGTGYHGVFLSTNKGASWTAANSGLTDSSVRALAVSGANLFAGTSVGVFISTNNGTSWTATGLTNTFVYFLAISGTNLFAGNGSGVFLSTNNGTSWVDVSNGLFDPIYALAVSGTNLFAGTWGGGVYLSTNNGTNWMAVNNSLPRHGDNHVYVTSLVVSGTNLFAGTWGGGVFRRPLFEMAKFPPHPFITSISDVPNDEGGNVLLTWSASSLDKNAATLPYYTIWREISQTAKGVKAAQKVEKASSYSQRPANRTMMVNGKESSWEWIAVVPSRQAPTYSYVAPTSSDSMSTTNGLQSFLVVAQTNNPYEFYPSNVDRGYSVDNLAPQAPRNLAFSIRPDTLVLHWNPNPETDIGRYVIYRSAHPITNPITLLPYASSRDTIFADTMPLHRAYYVIRAQDTHENYSLPGNQVRVIFPGPLPPQWVEAYLDSVGVLCFAASDSNLFAGTGEGIFRSSDGDTSWIVINEGLTGRVVRAMVAYGKNVLAATDSGVFVSSNDGDRWTRTSLTNSNVNGFALSPDGANLFASTIGSGVFLTTNNGTSWTQVNTGLTDTNVTSLAVLGTNLIAGTYGYGGGVYLSTNNGTSWIRVDTAVAAFIISLSVSGTNLFAISPGPFPCVYRCQSVFISTDNGTSWTVAGVGGPVNPRTLAVSGTNLFAGTTGGVLVTTNSGTNWTEVSTGLAGEVTTALYVYGSFIFAGTTGGVWKRPLSEMITSVHPPSSVLPRELRLEQNYPNPFNPLTTITYSLPSSGRVYLSVFNVLGQEIATLVDGVEYAGYKSVSFDANRLSSGIYIYRITAGTFTDVKKMVLIK